MNRTKIIERVAAGLRAIDSQPKALLFLDGLYEWTWDELTCLGVMVLHSAGLHCGANDCMAGPACPFVPLWTYEHKDAGLEVRRFVEAYSEWTDQTKGGTNGQAE